ncbi:MAG TPA: hypothetical protein VFC67_07920 [Prolixibacteraceae bacterium]|nr:hypothetical protein [Prolixibacteraceae bacterium]
MNNLRTIILILVTTIQISGMLTNISWESIRMISLTGKVCKEIKHEASSKMDKRTHKMNLNLNRVIQGQSNPICGNEATLKSATQTKIISDKQDEIPVVKTSENNQQPANSNSGMSQISFNASVSAELF